jgi:hypothetical protein
MTRITDSMLSSRIACINSYLGTPTEHYSVPGKANVGHLYLSYQYSGVALYQAGANGDRNVFGVGFVTRPLMFEMLGAYLRGIQDAKEVFCKG